MPRQKPPQTLHDGTAIGDNNVSIYGNLAITLIDTISSLASCGLSVKSIAESLNEQGVRLSTQSFDIEVPKQES